MRIFASLAAASLVTVTSIARAQSPAPLPPLPEPTTPQVNIDTGERADPEPAAQPKPAPAAPAPAAVPTTPSDYAAPATPEADDPAKPRFAKAGTAVISTDMQFSAQYVSNSEENGAGGDSTTTIALQPAFDYFVGDNISIGGLVSFAAVTHAPKSGDSTTVTGVGAGFRIGAYLGDARWGLWPKVGLGYVTASSDGASTNAASIDAFAPIVFHVIPHFFVGVGPNLDVQLTNSVSNTGGASTDLPKQTRVGVAFAIGGWW